MIDVASLPGADISKGFSEWQDIDLNATEPMQKLQGLATKASAEVERWLTNLANQWNEHKTAIVLGSLLNGTNSVAGIHRFGKLGSLAQSMIALIGAAGDFVVNMGGLTAGLNDAVAREINAIADELKNPNIEGIPIHADSEVDLSEVDVSTKLLVNEVDSNKDYRVDSSCPKLKSWSIK